jgi:hypothetical protein
MIRGRLRINWIGRCSLICRFWTQWNSKPGSPYCIEEMLAKFLKTEINRTLPQRDDNVHVAGNKMLVLAEDFTKATLQEIASDGGADAAGGNHGEPRQVFGSRSRSFPEGKNKSRPKLAAAFLANGREIRLSAQVLPGPESHGLDARACR